MTYDGTTQTPVGEATSGTPVTSYTLDPTGSPTAVTWTTGTTTNVQQLGTDGQGNVTEITGTSDSAGSSTGPGMVVCSVALDPWGKPLTSTTSPTAGPNATTGQNVGSSPSPCQRSTSDQSSATASDIFYRDARRESGGGTYQLGSRDYDATKTSFTSPDTFRSGTPADDLALGTNPETQDRYNYVDGDPVNQDDPSGHDACCEKVGLYTGTHLTAAQRLHNAHVRNGITLTNTNTIRQIGTTIDRADSDERNQNRIGCFEYVAAAHLAPGTYDCGDGFTEQIDSTDGDPHFTFDNGGGYEASCDPTGHCSTRVSSAITDSNELSSIFTIAAPAEGENKSVSIGKQGENFVKRALGGQVNGVFSEITFKVDGGRTRIDHLVVGPMGPGGKIMPLFAIEVKTNGGVLNANQERLFPILRDLGGTAVGKKAESAGLIPGKAYGKIPVYVVHLKEGQSLTDVLQTILQASDAGTQGFEYAIQQLEQLEQGDE